MTKGRLPRELVLSPTTIARVLQRLAMTDAPGSQELYTRLMGSWGQRPDRAYITFRPTSNERLVLRQIPLPADVVSSPFRYVGLYRCDKKPSIRVKTRTAGRPPLKRKFRVAGGTRRFTLVRLYRVNQTKESIIMAKTKAGKGKGKNKAKPAEDPVDELAAELEGLEEIEVEDEEEPDVEEEESEDEDEEEDDDEEVDYTSMTNADLKKLCKTRGIKGIDKANKTKLVAMLVADDAEDDEEDEEDESPLDGLDRAELKAYNKEHDLGVSVKKSMTDDDLRAALQEALPEDEEEDDEEEDDEEEEDDGPDFDAMDRKELKAYLTEQDASFKAKKSQSDDDLRELAKGDDEDDEEDEKPKGKAKGGKKGGKGKGGKQPGQLVRELPKGRKSAADIATMIGGKTDALAVRNFLRSEKGQKFPKDPELGRYSFTEKQAAAVVKAFKAARGK